MPKDAADCLKMAEEAIATAEQAEIPAQRDAMLKFAQQWMRLAEFANSRERIDPKPRS